MTRGLTLLFAIAGGAAVGNLYWSQPLLGVIAESLDEVVTPDLAELDDARWFARDEVIAMLARTHPDGLFAPPPAAIAHHLMRRFAGL